MDRVGVVGISWKQRAPESLAEFAVPRERLGERLARIAESARTDELVYLATCNRVELYFVAPERRPLETLRRPLFEALCGRAAPAGEAERVFRAWGGEGAVEHLFLVAAGLEAARIGETDVSAQVREAAARSRALRLLGPRLDRIFAEALRVARKVHGATGVSSGKTSLAEIALARVRAALTERPGPVALLGVSAMTERCARALADDGIAPWIVNRTLARAEALAAAVGGRALALASFRADPPALRAAVLATGAPEPLLGRPELERLARAAQPGSPPLLVDLGLPPDVDAAAAAALGFERMGLDELAALAALGRERRLSELADARAIVDQSLVGMRRKLLERRLAPLLAGLQDAWTRVARDEVDALLARELAGLPDERRAALERFAERLARRFAHLPSRGLREIGFEHGAEAVERFFDSPAAPGERSGRAAGDGGGQHDAARVAPPRTGDAP